MKNIVLFGGGTHAKYCIDIIHKQNKYNIVGITDPYAVIGEKISSYKIIGRQEELSELIPKYNIQAGLITIGDNWVRKRVKDIIDTIAPDFEFVSAIHPSTIIGENVEIGCGTIIMAGCIISPGVRIKNFCFLASGAILEHDSLMEEFSSLSAGSVTGGKVRIGRYSAVTLGVVLFDRIEIGEHTVVGSGSLVTKDIPSNVLAYGTPARIIRGRDIGEKYLA